MSRCIIVGAGIGGLAAGIALRRAGVEVDVFERADSMGAVGAGISLWANAITGLDRLGVGAAIRDRSVAYTAAGLRTWDGKHLSALSPEMLRARFEPAIVVMHRADLQAILLAAFGSPGVRTGMQLTGVRQEPERAVASFSDGTSAEADCLVGADGLHSVVRAHLHGKSEPRYAGCTAWRAVVPSAGGPPQASESWGRGRVFGQVPMAGGHVYWYATHNEPAGGRNISEKAELLRSFGSWHAPIGALIEAADETKILRNDIYDRRPLATWGRDRITLVGDAAHPMTPYMGQGGCQAIEDAVVLGQCLQQRGDIRASLRAYEARRIRRANTFVHRSHVAGRIAQLENALAVGIRNALIKAAGPRLQTSQILRLIGGADFS
jgi:2-polyprenyl-6-methoxyphenol hydroxylase-like FAD-dependent oxidoreductase